MALKADFDTPKPLFLFTTEEEGICASSPATRGTQVETITSAFSFGVSEFNGSGTAVTSFQNIRPFHESVSAAPVRFNSGRNWEADAISASASYTFSAYAPYVGTTAQGVTLLSGNKTLSYSIAGLTVAEHPDLMTAHATSAYAPSVPLTFQHRLCAVRIVTGTDWQDGMTLTCVRFSGIIPGGTLEIDADKSAAWTSTDTRTSYSAACSPEACFMMVPQSLSGVTLTITLTDATGATHTLTASLTGSWTAGKTVTYTLNLEGITALTATYPQWTDAGSGATYGPFPNYDVGPAQFGLFAVKDGSVVLTNVPIGVQSVSTATHVATLKLPEEFLSGSYTYYLYYPYRTTLPGTVNPSASDAPGFFAGVIGNWSVPATQNTLSDLKALDLQVGKLSGTSFTMAHRMGLAKITLTDKEVEKTWTYTYSGSGEDSYTLEKSTDKVILPAPSIMETATASRLVEYDGFYWTIVKSTGASTNESVTLRSDQSFRDRWTQVVNGLGYGKYRNYPVQTERSYKFYVGKFPYSGVRKHFQAPWHGYYKLMVWGAQGCTFTRNTRTYRGGYGAFAEGRVELEKDTDIYVMVGQQGRGTTGLGDTNEYTSWPNGGIGQSGDNVSFAGSGGGSTHIALVNKLPKEMTHAEHTSGGYTFTDVPDLLILAAGGGGGTYTNGGGWYGEGGDGGGYQGYDGTSYTSSLAPGRGGGHTYGGQYGIPNVDTTDPGYVLYKGSFGLGGGRSQKSMSGGGGGLYGGGSSWGAGGGGGSSYIGNDLLLDLSSTNLKRMVAYYGIIWKTVNGVRKPYIMVDGAEVEYTGYSIFNQAALTQPNDPRAFLTLATDKVSENPEEDKAKKGDGYARIESY